MVELLVVLAVLSLLAGILLSSLSAARARARATDCRTNLYQIGLALRLYADDYDGGLPLSLYWSRELARRLRVPLPYGCPDVRDWYYNPRAQLHFSEKMIGYGYNGLLGRPGMLNGRSSSVNLAQVTFPATTVAFCDAAAGTLTLAGADRSEGGTGPLEQAALRHRGGANYAFLDGNVKWHRPEEIDILDSSGQPDGSKPHFIPYWPQRGQ
jgi:prepilin-type processing-associated H-X9-DG protein